MANGSGTEGIRLPLCQVLEEEERALDDLPPTTGESPWLFTKNHLVTDPVSGDVLLLALIVRPQKPLSEYLHTKFQLLLGKYAPNTPPLEEIANLLNTFLDDPALYEKERFSQEALTPNTQALLKLSLEGDDLRSRNRLLLEEAYPHALRKVEAVHEERLAKRYRDRHEKKRAALCLSGGGIRSATFNLGVLQGLATHGLLDKFDYLSTVSGGGYIGSWLTAWIHRHPQGARGVCHDLRSLRPTKSDPEAAPIRHLREYSNYLTPQWGLLSADTWTWVAIYLRNLLLTWLVLLPLLAAALLLPRFVVATVRLTPTAGLHWAVLPWLLLVAGFALGAKAIDYINVNLPRKGNPAKDQLSFLRGCLCPLLGSAFAMTTFWAWFRTADQELPGLWVFLVFGAALHLAGSAMNWIRGRRSIAREEAATTPLPLRQRIPVLLPMAIAGLVGGLCIWWAATALPFFLQPRDEAGAYVCFAVPLLLTVFLAATMLYIGLRSHATTDEDREWWARASAWVLITMVSWGTMSWLVIFGPELLAKLSETLQTTLASLGGLSAIITLLAGRSTGTPANQQETEKADWQAKLLNTGLQLAAPLFVIFLVIVLSLGTNWLLHVLSNVVSGLFGCSDPGIPLFSFQEVADRPWDCALFVLSASAATHAHVIAYAPIALVGLLLLLLVAVGWAMGKRVNINKFSLHSAYRNRLIRAYLGASVDEKTRNPHPFIGFDPQDNVQMHELSTDAQQQKRLAKPLHVINVALNLVKGEKLAWQQRKAESFTVSPLHAGSSRLGYRRSQEYGGQKDVDGSTAGISLGTAVAISGAAASPNMGYHSSSVITFLMALFNVRLGWWLGNPGVAGSLTFRRRGPEFAVGPLMAETFGLTNDTNPYVYLSDGGHFENLGLYEMVLRRCHFIVVSDAGCDPDRTFEDLGNAIRKIRIDLGVPIELEKICIYPRKEKKVGKCCALGKIHYARIDGAGVEDGILLYLKPTFYGNETVDVVNYAQVNSAFPHESTNDQWFSESQFESYRMLGYHTMAEICGIDAQAMILNTLADQTRSYLQQTTLGDFLARLSEIWDKELPGTQLLAEIKELVSN